MRTLIPIAGLLCTGAAFAQDRSTTPSPVPPNVPVLPGTGGGGTSNGPASGGGLLYDNGSANGANGYSNATIGAIGERRTLLDDFTVPAATTWPVGCIAWTHVWSTAAAGSGIGAEFDFRNDAAGTPGPVFATANVTAYTEVATGNIFFSRPEAASTATFSTIPLGTGTYWFEGTVVGPENNFWLTASQQGNECWVNYPNLSGLVSGTTQFGVASDLNFQIREADDRIKIYCDETTNPNNMADISVSGNVGSNPPILVDMAGAPPNQFTYLLVSMGNASLGIPPGAKGTLCLGGGGAIGRYTKDIQSTGAGGTATTDISNSQSGGAGFGLPNPPGGIIQAGDTWYFQYWHRQPMGGPSSFSSAACVTFKP